MYVTPKFIEDLRNDLGYTLSEFADMFKVNTKTVFNWEAGVTAPSPNFQAQMIQLRNRINYDRNKNVDNTGEVLKGILITGGILAFLFWLFNNDTK